MIVLFVALFIVFSRSTFGNCLFSCSDSFICESICETNKLLIPKYNAKITNPTIKADFKIPVMRYFFRSVK